MTRIWLVADDYGISKSVNVAICDLIARGRINGTSVMTVAPDFDRHEANLLSEAARTGKAEVGLHLTLTAPFRPLTKTYRPLRENAFLSLGRTFAFGLMGLLDPVAIAAEVRAQISAFIAAFGRPPDFIDGHQHVQLLPPVAESLLTVMHENAPNAWVRQCGSLPGVTAPDIKARVLNLLSGNFRNRAARHGVRTNRAFAGTYNFHADKRFDALFPTFLDAMTEDGLIMCHPGIVDDALRRLDSLTTLREREYEYFKSETFVAALAARNLALR
ncbi:MAG: ChbG/HpnK family deacetylase [Xanthobacteraceae bacterium]